MNTNQSSTQGIEASRARLTALAWVIELFNDSYGDAQGYERFAGWVEHQDYFEDVWAE